MRSLPFTTVRRYVVFGALLLLVGGFGYRLGENHSLGKNRSLQFENTANPQTSSLDFSLFWNVWERLKNYYIDADSIDPQKMLYGAITGMVGSLGDPYTSFLPPKENTEFKQDIGGEFEGIGAQLGIEDNQIMVIAPLKGTPAEEAGIRAGDYILKVNDEDTNGWSVQEAVTKIRGPKNTTVTLEIFHKNSNKPITLTIARKTISVPSVDSWIKPINQITEISSATQSAAFRTSSEKIAYIRLSRFGDHTNDEWDKAVSEVADQYKKKTIDGLVFDLRNNPGGYLEGAVYISSEFIPSGVVVSQKNSDGSKTDYTVNRKGKLLDIPVMVLLNKGSASASEITGGALHDHGRATIVGETSFGKGSVQTPQDLPGGSSLHVTTGKWLLPSGQTIHKKGITPDVMVNLDSFEASKDAQLAKAIELLLKH